MVNFVKDELGLESDLDRWLYVLKNMSKMDKLPIYLRKPIFEKLFRIAEYSKLNKEEREMYDISLKNKWDEYSIRRTQEQMVEEAIEKGLEQGLAQGLEQGLAKGLAKGRKEERAKAEAEKLAEKRTSAIKMLKGDFNVEMIADILGLSVEEIEKLK
ncbi:PD-(D/E)XK nuclease family transposase [Sphingobacterium sp. SGG-5]|uniref:PD-(D/E)XK nuclease family transposase n=1 Tax=Sphingobacterium sp. SGG-5 TaxID=2710881 RepID=UPI0021D19DF4|nr:PD-(D/E)XK nuclease family transposase [Sphingobacterium sp. SGG-5]